MPALQTLTSRHPNPLLEKVSPLTRLEERVPALQALTSRHTNNVLAVAQVHARRVCRTPMPTPM